jgi:hypothetical protein
MKALARRSARSARRGARGPARWSQAQLEAFLNRPTGGATPAASQAITTLPRPSAATIHERLARAIASIQSARVTWQYEPEQSVSLHFEGAISLSPNELYKLTHFRRIPYRRAWHEAIYWSWLDALEGRPPPPPWTQFAIVGHRVSTRLCDPDALNGYFKYAIDGLRYAGIIVDDKPANLIELRTTQATGPVGLTLEIRRVADPLSPLSSDRARRLR